MRVYIRCIVLYIVLIILFLFTIRAYAEENAIETSEKDFISYMQTIDEQKKKMDEMEKLILLQNDSIINLNKLNKKIKLSDEYNEAILNGKDNIIAVQNKLINALNLDVLKQIDAIEKLETKGNKNILRKLSFVLLDAGAGAIIGTVVPGVGTVIGAGIGALSGIAKSFIFDLF